MCKRLGVKKVKFFFGLVTVAIKDTEQDQTPKYYLENDRRICLNVKSIKGRVRF